MRGLGKNKTKHGLLQRQVHADLYLWLATGKCRAGLLCLLGFVCVWGGLVSKPPIIAYLLKDGSMHCKIGSPSEIHVATVTGSA